MLSRDLLASALSFELHCSTEIQFIEALLDFVQERMARNLKPVRLEQTRKADSCTPANNIVNVAAELDPSPFTRSAFRKSILHFLLRRSHSPR